MTIVRRAQAPRLGPLPSLGREAGARALTARIARRTRSITSNEIAKPPTKPPRPSSPRTTRRDLECTAPLPRAGGAGGGRRSHRNVSQHSLPIHRNVSQHSLPIHPNEITKPPDQTAETFKALLPSRVREGPGEGGGPRATSPSTASQSTPTRSRSPRPNRRDLQSTAPLPRAGGAGGGRRSPRNISQHSLPIHPNEIAKPQKNPMGFGS
jgi:hypothetical protein